MLLCKQRESLLVVPVVVVAPIVKGHGSNWSSYYGMYEWHRLRMFVVVLASIIDSFIICCGLMVRVLSEDGSFLPEDENPNQKVSGRKTKTWHPVQLALQSRLALLLGIHP